MKLKNLNKSKKLGLGLLFDALGYVSFIFPPFDFVWAPLSAYLMTRMYAGRKGKIAAVFSFVEEALPFVDIIPSFSIMWFYTFYFSKETKPLQFVREEK
ncbi:hypothetical protein BZARG_86 [Bizionia argentinensis JUB59]|uniref:Uncharacterized protein n=1 Tax=Bizionia argentinensis JUB59 TaxID=1046627 RepID=G2E975_9FLAO|nr:hypothetical protein [Bizionia argentinensis]EGV44927.1 hypothetical protein BZARG_86 [Bizionia argentinensis JUB59]